MLSKDRFKGLLASAAIVLALAACSDGSTELASPGNSGPNPGVGGGGSSGGGGGGGGAAVTCPAGTTAMPAASPTYCALPTGTITEDTTLTSEGVAYSISGTVFVGEPTAADGSGGNPVTLTIEPGVTVYAETAETALVITRGSTINAEGSSSAPIIMTSAEDAGFTPATGSQTSQALHDGLAGDDTNSALWGGLVINGLAPINVCGSDPGICEKEGEGGSGLFGGDNPNDSSGTLKYVVVKYAGQLINSTNELNGIAFQGVGDGTLVDYVQVHNGADDGIEFFGGTVNAKHIVVSGANDDSIDWTDGWTGNIQYAIVLQNANLPDTDRGIEGDNYEFGEDNTPRSRPTISNVTFVGADSTDPNQAAGDTGVLIRRGSGLGLYNAVVTNWQDACFDMDSDATITQAGAGNVVVESVLFGCDDPVEMGDAEDATFGSEAFVDAQPNTEFGETSLSGFINGPNEAAVTATDVSAIDGFFDAVDFIGAVKDADSNWTQGWTFGLNEGVDCPNVDGVTETTSGACLLQGTITDDLRLAAGRDYLLRGSVFIGQDMGPDPAAPLADGDPASLFIDAGVRVLAEDPESALFISRGSKIFANGTAANPIIMSAINDETRDLDGDTALWGGLVINGRASINVCNTPAAICEKDGEGGSGKFGGLTDDDDSGSLRYVVVKYAGRLINSTNELNGIAFQGVGSGTTVDYVQVHNGADDGIEFFGGTVSAKHLVVTGANDDSIDWTDGWRGNIQYALVIQNPNQPDTDRGIEADNYEFGFDNEPRSAPSISNATFIGAEGDSIGDTAIVIRRGTALRMWNFVATNWTDACYDMDNDATFTVSGPDATTLNGPTLLQSALLDCTTPLDDEAGDPFVLTTWFDNQANNDRATASTLQTRDGGTKAYINGTAETAATATDPNAVDAFFDSVDFIGAVPSDDDWTEGWTVWLD